MHVSCQQAGMLLARLGRPEVANCISGLEQFSYAYEEAGEYANDIRSTFERNGDGDFRFMGDVASRVAYSAAPPSAIMMDDTMPQVRM